MSRMIMFNTLTGFLAGIVLMTAAGIVYRMIRNQQGPFLGEATVLLIAGVPLTILSGIGTVTWPLNVNDPINIAFWEPSLLLGTLAVGGGLVFRSYSDKIQYGEYVKPVGWLLFGIGSILATIASAIWSYNLVGDAPAAEPITGQFHGWENTAFGAVYLLAGIGCLVAPLWQYAAAKYVMRFSWAISGIMFTVFSIINYRTHIGLLVNLITGSHYHW